VHSYGSLITQTVKVLC